MSRSVPTDKLGEALRITPGSKVHLDRFDAGQTFGHDKASAKKVEAELEASLSSLQERLWAEAKHPVLIVLQGIDAAGKDGTIRKVMDAFNPMGCDVTSFKVPTPLELSHDYLWRVHPHAPAKGSIAIFNRSHYEDVLVVRVHGFVPETVWRKRYDQINDWERTLTEEGTTIVKLFLYIDKDEQKRTAPGPDRRPDQELEVPVWRPARAGPLGQVHRRLRGMPRANLDRRGAVVSHPGEPQLVPRSGGVAHRRGDARSTRPALPAAGARHRQGRRRLDPRSVRRSPTVPRSERDAPDQRPIDEALPPAYGRAEWIRICAASGRSGSSRRPSPWRWSSDSAHPPSPPSPRPRRVRTRSGA